MAEEAKAETASAEAAGSEKKGGATGSGGEPAAKKLGSTSVFGLGQPPSTSATLRGQVLATFPTALAGAATIVVSIGFVAAVGALMLWVRFRAAGLPADQAIVAVPREDVVSIGAVLLTQYVAIGLAAVLLVRFRDRYGNASPATRRALADLLLVELLAVGLIVGDANGDDAHPILAAVMVVIAWGLLRFAVWLSREGPTGKVIRVERTAIIAGWFADRAHLETVDRESELDLVRRARVSPATAEVETSASQWDTAEKAFRETAKEGKDQPSLLWSFALSRTWMRAHVALDSLVDAVARLKAASAAEAQAEAALTDAKFLEVQSAGSAACAERDLVEAQSEALIDPAIQHRDNPLWWAEDDGLVRIVLRGLALALAIGAAAFLDQGAWLIAVVPVAVVLALGALSIAHATSDTRFFWTGVALFASGLLFGACFTLLRTNDAPKLQPVGVLLNPTAGQACGTFLSGAYVARTGSKDDDRIYFGNADRVSNDRNTYDFLNGRLTSVPNSEVAAHAVGSLVNPYSGSPAFDNTVRALKEDLENQAGCSR